ncbi:anaerobic sulfatase maturase [candidate division KSB1 bacterium]|nr:anaerobic sulfatase maturase [candidate division KSB1 bacterium]
MNRQSDKQLFSLLIKPAGPDCNLACAYCFYRCKSELFGTHAHRMSDEILKTTVRNALRTFAPIINFSWQGGEPTLMTLDFFRRAVEYQLRCRSAGQIVQNGFQTNGILLDRKWAKFFVEADFLVGLSLDGPQHIHDRYRRSGDSRGTWEQVVRARDLLLEQGVKVNALIVVNDYSANYAREIYEYHRKNGIEFMQFIPCVETDPRDPERAASFSVSAESYGVFLCELFDLWIQDFRYGRPTTSIRFFESVFSTYVGLDALECTLAPECGTYLVVEHTGDVFPCDFFVEEQLCLGNVKTDDLGTLLNSSEQNSFGGRKSRLPDECRRCEWLIHCFGGCPKDRQRDLRDRGSNHFCRAFQQFFTKADPVFRRLAQKWRVEQGMETVDAPRPVGRNDPCPCSSGRKYKHCCGS